MNPLDDLPPYDQLQYYASPIETLVAVGVTPVVGAVGDPMRRLVAFQLIPGATGTCLVSTNQASIAKTGFVLNSAAPLIFTWKEHGSLPSVGWFLCCTNPGNANVSVLTYTIVRWPGANGYVSPLELVDNGQPPQPSGQPLYGNGDHNGISDSWAKSAAAALDDIASAYESCQREPWHRANGNQWIPPSRWGRTIHPRLQPLRRTN